MNGKIEGRNSNRSEGVPSLNRVVKKFNGLIENNILKQKPSDNGSPDPQVSETIPNDYYDDYFLSGDPVDPRLVNSVAEQLEEGLKRAKSSQLNCCEVLIPCHLTHQIALDILSSSDLEPCGLRSCIIHIYLESEDSKESRKIGSLRPVGANPVPTFELYLYLKRSSSGWLNLNKFFGRNSIVISDSYQLSKKKLFRSGFT